MGWKSEVCNVLRTTDKKQGKNAFFHFDYETGVRTDACALGALICAKQPVKNQKDYNKIKVGDVLMSYQIPMQSLMIDDDSYKYLSYEGFPKECVCASIDSFIVGLNDICELTFKEIADCLEATFPEDD